MFRPAVYLVGAGPGSPDLITVRGLRILQSADVVLYDALVSPELVAEARPGAELVSVGKRGYCVGSTRQETINEALVRHGRSGGVVCRLKCGDPCVFGRGGEEAAVLAGAGIAHEIVPGVTSALGACAEAGIPLTHRDVGQAVVLATGHHDPDSPDCTLDWEALARMPAVVFYMAARHLARIAQKLVECGVPPDRSCALLVSATLAGQTTEVLTLAELALRAGAPPGGPTLLVVGEVVRLGSAHRLAGAPPESAPAPLDFAPRGRYTA